jgi:putative tryptophan/tyrosine transport system substrate-binding protein
MPRSRRRTFFAVALTALVLCLSGFPGSQPGAGETRIAVLLSHNWEPYQKTLEGFQSHLRRQGISAVYDRHLMEGDAGKPGLALRSVNSGMKPGLVLALGSLAVEAAVSDITDTPIIAGMILRPDLLKKTPNATGVFLDFPVEIQLKWIQTILPSSRTVGVLYNPKENRERVDMAVKVASRTGLKVEAVEINTPADFLPGLNGLGRNVDVLWGLTDGLVFNSLTAKHLLLHSQKHSIPLVGISSAWVKAGALYALEADYTDIGTQCGEMAAAVLQGTNVNTLAPAFPRRVTYALNLGTAGQLKVRLSPELIRGAFKTY